PSLSSGSNSGARVGTPAYMSPEQARTEPVDSATDIFSLGLVFYELATGRHPFLADSELEVLDAIASQPHLPASRINPEVPAALETLLAHMLAKDPRRRPTAVEVEAALHELTETPERRGSRLTSPERLPMVGRKEEWAALRAGFGAAAAGRGTLLCVTG